MWADLWKTQFSQVRPDSNIPSAEYDKSKPFGRGQPHDSQGFTLPHHCGAVAEFLAVDRRISHFAPSLMLNIKFVAESPRLLTCSKDRALAVKDHVIFVKNYELR